MNRSTIMRDVRAGHDDFDASAVKHAHGQAARAAAFAERPAFRRIPVGPERKLCGLLLFIKHLGRVIHRAIAASV